MQDALSRPFHVAGHELVVSASIGIAVSTPGCEPAELVRDADIAMYDAKREGAARSSVFSAPMHNRVVSQLHLEGELRRAIDEDLLRVFYQPIFDLRTRELSGFEALARWPDVGRADLAGRVHPGGRGDRPDRRPGPLVLDHACAG